MPLFVFISGYLAAASLSRHSVQDVFQSRCRSLLIPFVSLSLLGILAAYALNMLFSNIGGRVDFLGACVRQLFLNPTVWFLFTLFALSCLLIVSVRWEKRFGPIIFLLIYLLLMIIPYNNYCALCYIKWFYLFYLAGYFFNKCSIKVPAAAVKTMIFLVSFLLFSLLVIHWHKSDYIYINRMDFTSEHYFYGLLRTIYRYIPGFLGIIIAFYVAGGLLKTPIASFLGIIGMYSLDIYIIQMFVLEGVYPRWIQKAGIHLDLHSPYVLYMVAPFLAMFFVGTCMLISKLAIRRVPLLNKLLLGGRG